MSTVEGRLTHYRRVTQRFREIRSAGAAGCSVAMTYASRANQYAVLMRYSFDPSRIYIRPLQILDL
jgi:hypothetical protein